MMRLKHKAGFLHFIALFSIAWVIPLRAISQDGSCSIPQTTLLVGAVDHDGTLIADAAFTGEGKVQPIASLCPTNAETHYDDDGVYVGSLSSPLNMRLFDKEGRSPGIDTITHFWKSDPNLGDSCGDEGKQEGKLFLDSPFNDTKHAARTIAFAQHDGKTWARLDVEASTDKISQDVWKQLKASLGSEIVTPKFDGFSCDTLKQEGSPTESVRRLSGLHPVLFATVTQKVIDICPSGKTVKYYSVTAAVNPDGQFDKGFPLGIQEIPNENLANAISFFGVYGDGSNEVAIMGGINSHTTVLLNKNNTVAAKSDFKRYECYD